MLELLVSKASSVIASDGGANYLYRSPYRDIPNFHTIIGDLDRIVQYCERDVHALAQVLLHMSGITMLEDID